MHKRAKTRVLYTLLGMIGGFVLLHPYTMMVYALLHVLKGAAGVHTDWGGITVRGLIAFKPAMFPMVSAFVIFGGLTGLLVALVFEKKRKMLLLEVENEKHKIAIQTLREVTVTLAHHLLNANTIIGGKVRHCRKLTSDQEILKVLADIEDQGRKIDATIGSLREVTEVKTMDYTMSGEVKMINIDDEIRERLDQTDKKRS
jgi:hypothetical protein